MDELLHQLLIRLRGMWHRRWIGLGVAWIAAIVGVGIALRIPDRYEASARVYVDTQTLLRPLLEGVSIQPNLDQQVVLMSRTLISRPNLEKLVRMTDLDLETKTSEGRENLLDGLSRTVYIRSIGQNLYSIGFTHRDRAHARRNRGWPAGAQGVGSGAPHPGGPRGRVEAFRSGRPVHCQPQPR